ncbi:MAG: hypothetical protein QOH07_1640, partial [Mycobacterium sp.]|nr:hypothetical protein [Mycobacterium sp.]
TPTASKTATSGESRNRQPNKPEHQGVNFQPSKRGQFSAAVDSEKIGHTNAERLFGLKH